MAWSSSNACLLKLCIHSSSRTRKAAALVARMCLTFGLPRVKSQLDAQRSCARKFCANDRLWRSVWSGQGGRRAQGGGGHGATAVPQARQAAAAKRPGCRLITMPSTRVVACCKRARFSCCVARAAAANFGKRQGSGTCWRVLAQ